MYGFCTRMNDAGSSPPLGQQLLREAHVLAGVRRSVLDQDALGGTPIAIGDRRELIRFRLVHMWLRDRAEAAGENQERRPAVEKELGAALGHGHVVAAEHQNGVGLRQLDDRAGDSRQTLLGELV